MSKLTVDVSFNGRKVYSRSRDAGGPAPLYVKRTLDVDVATRLGAWARSAGLQQVLAPADMHVTVAFSRAAVDWFAIDPEYMGALRVSEGGPRRVEIFGPAGDPKAVVLRFQSSRLHSRWQELRDAGCSWDFPQYAPHVTVAKAPGRADVTKLAGFSEELRFGPEIWMPLEAD